MAKLIALGIVLALFVCHLQLAFSDVQYISPEIDELPSNFVDEDVFGEEDAFLEMEDTPTQAPAQSSLTASPSKPSYLTEVPDDAAEAPPDLPIPEDDDDEDDEAADDEPTDDGVDDVDDDFGPATLLQVDQKATTVTPESLFLELYKVIHAGKATRKTKDSRKHKHNKVKKVNAPPTTVAQASKEIDTAELSMPSASSSLDLSSRNPLDELNAMPTEDELEKAELEARRGGEALRRAVFLALSTTVKAHKKVAKQSVRTHTELPGAMPTGDEIEKAEAHMQRASFLEVTASDSPDANLPPPDDTYLPHVAAPVQSSQAAKQPVSTPRFVEQNVAGPLVSTDGAAAAAATPALHIDPQYITDNDAAAPAGGAEAARFTTKLKSEHTEAELTPITSASDASASASWDVSQKLFGFAPPPVHNEPSQEEGDGPAYEHIAYYEQPQWRDVAQLALDVPGN